MIRHWVVGGLFPLLTAAASAQGTPETPPPPAPAQAASTPEAVPEEVVRKRFLAAYQSAQTPARKSEAVAMLGGLKEAASHRMLSGMLADRLPEVRVTACRTIAQTPDPDGYFVKPLVGLLKDRSADVRQAAAAALGAATVKTDAIRALAFELMAEAGRNVPAGGKTAPDTTWKEYSTALQRLTGVQPPAGDARVLSNFWMDFWIKNEKELRAESERRKPETPEAPANREGLRPDSFDKMEREKAAKEMNEAP